MTFQVKLQVLLSAKAQRDPLALSRTIELPFAPFSGLTLFGLMDHPEEPVAIGNVAYSVRDRNFLCELESDEYCREDEEESGLALTMADKLDEYGGEWEVNEPGDTESDDLEDEE